MPDLTKHHHDQLQRSGLTDATIKTAGVYSVLEPVDYRRLANLHPQAEANVPALAFPYPGCPGYVRLRPDDPRKRNPEFVEVTAEAPFPSDLEPEYVAGPKYLSPAGSPTRLYVRTDMCPAILVNRPGFPGGSRC